MRFHPNTEKKGYKWEVVVLLWIAFFLNQADRQAFNIVLPQIQTLFGANDSTMGLIAMLFNVFYAITVPFAGFYADRLSRSRQIIVSTLIFSAATFFTGFANGLLLFILFRCAGMGVGQGMFGPTYTGLIAQYHDSTTRARALSLHQTSSYIGVICCGVLAGYIADKLGWQYSFFIFGGLGLVLTVVLLARLRDRTQEKSLPQQTQAPAVQMPSFKDSVAAFFKVPTAVCLLIAYTGGIFVITGYLTWMPKLMKETFDLTMSSAGFHSMFWANVAAFFGVMLGGSINDKLTSRGKGSNRLVVQTLGLLLAVPCIALMGLSHNFIVVCAALAGFGLFRGMFESGTYPVLYDVISSKFYSMSSAVMILFGFSIGALAPWLLGIISDNFGLAQGVALLGVVWFVVSIALILARVKYYKKDNELLKNEDN